MKKIYYEHQEYVIQSINYDSKTKRHVFYLQNLQVKLNELEEIITNLSIKKGDKSIISQKNQLISEILSSVKKDLKGSPNDIIKNINIEALNLNKERIARIKSYEFNYEHKPIESGRSQKKSNSTTIKDLSLVKSFKSMSDLNTLEIELFNKSKDGPYKENKETTVKSIEEITSLSYEEVNDIQYFKLLDNKESIIRDNAKIEKAIKCIDETYEKKYYQLKSLDEHQQKRLMMLREVN